MWKEIHEKMKEAYYATSQMILEIIFYNTIFWIGGAWLIAVLMGVDPHK